MKKLFISLLLFSSYSFSMLDAPRALYNFGQTCYMNSTLQALFAVNVLIEFISKNGKEYYKPSTISSAYTNLVNDILSGKLTDTDEYDDKSLKVKAYKPQPEFCIPVFEKFFPPEDSPYHTPQDAPEFLRQLVEQLSDTDIKEKYRSQKRYNISSGIVNFSPVNEIFGFILNSIISYVDNGINVNKPNFEFNKALELGVALLPEQGLTKLSKTDFDNLYKTKNSKHLLTNLEQALDNHFKKEQLIGENQYKLNGKRIDAERQLFLRTLPNYFILKFNRFLTVGGGIMREEGDKKIRFPFAQYKLEHNVSFNYDNLSFEKYLDETVKENANIKDIKYRLIAIVQHTGGVGGGHYTAYVNVKDQWYFCNDTAISKVDEQRLQAIAANGGDGSFTPYILIYKQQKDITLEDVLNQIPDVKEKLEKSIFEPDITTVVGLPANAVSLLFDLETTLNFLSLKDNQSRKK